MIEAWVSLERMTTSSAAQVPLARNVIFGNGDFGLIIIFGAGSDRNKVQGNYIGTNAAGTAALVTGANVPDIFGVRITEGAQNNIIGGTVSGAGNVIAGLTNGIGVIGCRNEWQSCAGQFYRPQCAWHNGAAQCR